jgi:hypothetical protein
MSKGFRISAGVACCLAVALLAGCWGDDETKTLTTELTDGKISAVVESEGKNVEIETDVSGESASVNITGEDGDVSVETGPDAKLPENMPKDIPAYPGLEIQVAADVGGGDGLTVQGSTPDALEKVLQFYRAQTAENGWTEASNSNIGGQQVLNYTKDGRVFVVFLMRTDEQTSVTMTVAKE